MMAQRGGREEEEDDGEVAFSYVGSPVPERCLAAAVMQGLGLVCICTALSDPAWLLVQIGQQNYVYGAAYILHLGFNLTEPPGAHQLLHQSGLYVLLLLTVCCYISILLGLTSFLLDFLGTRYMKIKSLAGILLPAVLHFITVCSSAASAALCTYLYAVLRLKVPIDPPASNVTLGESYYFAIFASLASIAATSVSSLYAIKYRRENRTLAARAEEACPFLQEPETPDSPGEYG